MPQPPHPRRPRTGGEDGDPHGAAVDRSDRAAATGKPTGAGTGASSSNSASGPDADAVFQFEPDRIVRAIVYHMLDEGLAREIAPDSVHNAVTRLRRRGVRPSIRRSAWVAMNNHERLEWLLAESRTVPLLRDDDVVLLGSRDA
jgi:hypothetical protein